jgi:hypothetical protein
MSVSMTWLTRSQSNQPPSPTNYSPHNSAVTIANSHRHVQCDITPPPTHGYSRIAEASGSAIANTPVPPRCQASPFKLDAHTISLAVHTIWWNVQYSCPELGFHQRYAMPDTIPAARPTIGRLPYLRRSHSIGCPEICAIKSKSLSRARTVSAAISAAAATRRSGIDGARC